MPTVEKTGACVGDRVVYLSLAALGEYEATIIGLSGQRNQYASIRVKVTRTETFDLSRIPIVAPNKMRRGTCFLATRPMWTGLNGKAK